MAPPIMVTMAAGREGEWRIDTLRTITGEPLLAAARLAVLPGRHPSTDGAVWSLLGSTGAPRYTTQSEQAALVAVQPELGRAQATSGAMIALRKNDAWWSLAADQRRKIFEEDARHIAMSMRFLPAIARRLYHARELGQPFDFLTYFEFAPEHAAAFDELLAQLRASVEWRYVEREVELRLSR